MTKAVVTRSIFRVEKLRPRAAEAYEAGVRGQSPRRGARGCRASLGSQAVFHVSIRPEAPGPRSTMSHPSGGSRRFSALLPGATPAQANATSACITRVNDRAAIVDTLLLPRRGGGGGGGGSQTEHLVGLEHRPRVLQHSPGDRDDRHLLAPAGADAAEDGRVLRHPAPAFPCRLRQRPPPPRPA